MSKGSIRPSRGTSCPCGGQFKSVYNEIIDFKIPICDSCSKPPEKFKVRKSVPNAEGKAEKREYYSALDGSPLDSIRKCVALVESVLCELKSGTYQPDRYKFGRLADEYLQRARERGSYPPEHDEFLAPGTVDRIEMRMRTHLRPYFQDMWVDEIDKHAILKFYRSYSEKLRTRDLATADLKTILRWAWSELEIIKTVPPFPEIKRARRRTKNEYVKLEDQAKIIKGVDNPKYQIMLVIAAGYALRPCEVRPLKVKDFVISEVSGESFFTIRRHASKGGKGIGNQTLPGRKSIKVNEYMGTLKRKIPDDLIPSIRPYLAGKKGEDYVFDGERASYVSHDTLRQAWLKSCAKLGIKCQLYPGVRHSTATEMHNLIGDVVKSSRFLGHTNAKTTENNYLLDDYSECEGMGSFDRFELRLVQ